MILIFFAQITVEGQENCHNDAEINICYPFISILIILEKSLFSYFPWTTHSLSNTNKETAFLIINFPSCMKYENKGFTSWNDFWKCSFCQRIVLRLGSREAGSSLCARILILGTRPCRPIQRKPHFNETGTKLGQRSQLPWSSDSFGANEGHLREICSEPSLMSGRRFSEEFLCR